MKLNADILIKGATILTINPQDEIIENGVLVISDSRIVEIGDATVAEKYQPAKLIDTQNMLVMPGFVNTHTHVPMTIFRGFADDISLHDWLYKHIFPAENQFVNENSVKIGSRVGILEMLRSGTTTFNDMYFYENTIAESAKALGIRALLSESIIETPAPNNPTPQDTMRQIAFLMEKWKDDPLVNIGVAAHAIYSCSGDLLQKAKALAHKNNAHFHIHLAETEKESEFSEKEFGKTPTQYLDSLGILDEKTIAAHSIYLNETDRKIMVEKRVGIAHNPECNMKIASGIAPIPELLKLSAKIGFGTDGVASNNNLNMLEEMHTAALLHKINSKDATVMTAKQVVRIATQGGADVLGMGNEIGSLEVGKKADLILIDMNKAHLVPLYNIYSQIVYSMSAQDIETVIVNGKIVMENKQIKSVNEADLFAEIKEIARRVQQSL